MFVVDFMTKFEVLGLSYFAYLTARSMFPRVLQGHSLLGAVSSESLVVICFRM